jgi:phenylalanyl-tRNA synthetase beta chain
MLDLGQPNHLFDREALAPEGIVVRMARAGERMTTLDGFERRLGAADLLICSGPEPVALAGVMGGAGSKVEGDTRHLLLEAAAFDASTVRRTSTRLGLRTDASARFEKSLDPHLPARAAAHFVRLLRELQPEVTLPAAATDVGGWSDPACTLTLRGARVRSLLGVQLPDAEIGDILERLGFGVRAHGTEMEVRVPAARATKDVTVEQDLVEEVGRVHRYGNVPEAPLVGALVPPPRDETWLRRQLVRRIEDRLAGAARFHQTLSYSFLPEPLLGVLGLSDLPHVEVLNPVAEGLVRIRRSVVPSLLGLLEAARRQRTDVRLFEVGKGYLPERPNERGEPAELHELALAWAGAPPAAGARFDAGRLPRLQGVVEDLVAVLGLAQLEWGACGAQDRPGWAHPARALAACVEGSDQPLAVVAPLDPALARGLGLEGELDSEVALACVRVDALLVAPRSERRYRPLPTHPGVKLDVALALPEEVAAATARAAIARAGKGLVADAELFDVFQGERLGAGRRSLAWHVLLQAAGRTLDDQDGQKFLRRLEREAQALGGELRRE